jgi:hypothetical protein
VSWLPRLESLVTFELIIKIIENKLIEKNI